MDGWMDGRTDGWMHEFYSVSAVIASVEHGITLVCVFVAACLSGKKGSEAINHLSKKSHWYLYVLQHVYLVKGSGAVNHLSEVSH